MEPLRQRTKDRNTAIIGQYECAKIFMNIDDLIHVTNGFYTDLVQYRQHPEGKSLGDLCLKHVKLKKKKKEEEEYLTH